MKKVILPLFALMCLAQWIVPGKMIYDQENVLSNGTIYKFKTEPIDPSDPFRGAYITLNFSENFVLLDTSDLRWRNGQDIFVAIYDSAGFAKIGSLAEEAPATGDYVAAKISYINWLGPLQKVFIDYPFTRFYMEESKAPEAERIYWEGNRNDSTKVTYAVVSVDHGVTSIKDVMINDKSIVDLAREAQR